MISTCRHYLETGRKIAEARSSSAVYEISRLILHRAVTGYGPDHYTTYSLFNQPFSIRNWREYVDKKDFCKILLQYNKKPNFKVLEDKVQFASKCQASGLPHPSVHFTINCEDLGYDFPDHQGGAIADAFDALEAGNYIVKTCAGAYGASLWSITKQPTGVLVHNDQALLTPGQFSERLIASGERYLVQEKIEVARSLKAIMPGVACGTFRLNSFLRADGSVVIAYAFAKPTAVGPVSDNFAGGASGNMLAMIDIEHQCISRVVRRAPSGLLTDITHHPDTGTDLRNYPVPELTQALDLARRCALGFAEVPAVGWDIVITDTGAMVLEGNPMFDPIGPQFCANQGVRHLVPSLLAGERRHAVPGAGSAPTREPA